MTGRDILKWSLRLERPVFGVTFGRSVYFGVQLAWLARGGSIPLSVEVERVVVFSAAG